MELVERIGRGGFGVVDKVKVDGKFYARKTLNVNQAENFTPEMMAQLKRRFVREATVQAEFDHRNIMPVVGLDLEEEPPSFQMPLAEGTLADDIVSSRTLRGKALNAIMDILAGLEEMHRIGITHRDLKPQNVLRLSSDNGDRYVISDFGLMSIKDTQVSVLTQTGMAKGSDYYTAPEITASLRRASAASDIYSVGCILHDFFGLVERIPCAQIRDTCPYGDIMRICTNILPDRRFPSVAALRDALLSFDEGEHQAVEQQINDYIQLINSDDSIAPEKWLEITNKIEASYPSDDSRQFLKALTLKRITQVKNLCSPEAIRLAAIYADWVKEESFNFEHCDAIANRITSFMELDDITCQAEGLIALLMMGTSHNRWYVERKFMELAGPEMSVNLAKRVALELRALGRRAQRAIEHLESSINVNKTDLHPMLANVFNQK